METKIYNLIMKYPIPSIIASLAMFVPFFLAIMFFRVSFILELGIWGVTLSSIALHSIVVFLWWFISYVANDLMYKLKNKKTPLDNEFQIYKWQNNVVVGSLFSLIIAFISLLICYFLNWNFKTFTIIVYVLPITRIFILLLEYIYLKKTNQI